MLKLLARLKTIDFVPTINILGTPKPMSLNSRILGIIDPRAMYPKHISDYSESKVLL